MDSIFSGQWIELARTVVLVSPLKGSLLKQSFPQKLASNFCGVDSGQRLSVDSGQWTASL
ncbi:MAG: hypothetical protein R3Y46_04715 [Opitutales bacterium]